MPDTGPAVSGAAQVQRAEGTGPGSLSSYPGTGDIFVQFARNDKKQSRNPAHDGHGYVKNPEEPGRRFLCDPGPPHLSCCPRAEVVEHASSALSQERVRI